MMDELEKAKTHHDNVATMKKHIANVKLLCELLLEADQPEEKKDEKIDISSQEVKVMLGDSYARPAKQATPGRTQTNHNLHDEANGDSIFDF